MANSLTTDPIIIDATASSEVTGRLHIQLIIWAHNSDHAIAVDNEIKLTDSAGKVIIQFAACVAKKSIIFPFPDVYSVNGVKATVLSGGEVFIFLNHFKGVPPRS
jgi:hypothetical protein